MKQIGAVVITKDGFNFTRYSYALLLDCAQFQIESRQLNLLLPYY